MIIAATSDGSEGCVSDSVIATKIKGEATSVGKMKNESMKGATSISGKGSKSDSVITISRKKEYEDVQLTILPSSETSVNVNASVINNEYGEVQLAILPSLESNVNVGASVIKDASVIKEEEEKMGMIDYGQDDTGKANIGGLKWGEQSQVEAMNLSVKFEHGRVSEGNAQMLRTNRMHSDVGCGVEASYHADEISNCAHRTQKDSNNKGFSLGAPRGDVL